MIASSSKLSGKPDAGSSEVRNNEEDTQRETEFLTCLVKTGHKSFLSHPLIEAFIVLKWQRVRIFFWISFAFYVCYTYTYRYLYASLSGLSLV
jgi:hypothetical protein